MGGSLKRSTRESGGGAWGWLEANDRHAFIVLRTGNFSMVNIKPITEKSNAKTN
jgi:hypothetical protein